MKASTMDCAIDGTRQPLRQEKKMVSRRGFWGFAALHGRIVTFSLFIALATGLFMGVGEARAADRPSWLGVKILSWEFKKLGNNEDKMGYVQALVKIRHTNNSRDRVVTALYDKKGWVRFKSGDIEARGDIQSLKVNRVNLDPGQSVNLVYSVPITKNECLYMVSHVNKQLLDQRKKFSITKWVFDLKVKSKKI